MPMQRLIEHPGEPIHPEVFIQISESCIGRALRTPEWTYCVEAPISSREETCLPNARSMWRNTCITFPAIRISGIICAGIPHTVRCAIPCGKPFCPILQKRKGCIRKSGNHKSSYQKARTGSGSQWIRPVRAFFYDKEEFVFTGRRKEQSLSVERAAHRKAGHVQHNGGRRSGGILLSDRCACSAHAPPGGDSGPSALREATGFPHRCRRQKTRLSFCV